ncbi:MAG TPA: hypothetical protein VGJ91_22890, partial [Polyangiaceae bacterium]
TGACAERLPVGDACSANNQCKTHDCSNRVCTGLVASGSGVACAARRVGGSGSDGGAALIVALIGGAAFARRRRGARPTPTTNAA